MLPKINTHAAHQFTITENNSISIEGFEGIDARNCFCIIAQGHRYHEHGITNGSVLLCCKNVEARDGDLVVVRERNRLAVYQYRTDPKVKVDGEKRILHDASEIHAKVLGSFNFYH